MFDDLLSIACVVRVLWMTNMCMMYCYINAQHFSHSPEVLLKLTLIILPKTLTVAILSICSYPIMAVYYHIAGNLLGNFNLVVWWIDRKSTKLKFANIYVCMQRVTGQEWPGTFKLVCVV